ncbi:MAG: hypothetical protein KDB03_25955 [Planctomycetales bacterium]|nr:hypothetical protein [Planctomycetales bacterium]
MLQIIGIFSEPMKISADYEPTNPELLKSPALENRRNLLLRWGMRVVAILFLFIAIICFFSGNLENAVGFGAWSEVALVFRASGEHKI